MAPDLGSAAPDFTLPNQDRQPGPGFFPAAFSGTCTKQMCTFRDSNAELHRASARVLGVSVDTFFALKAWGDAEHIDFPPLSDFNKTVIRAYGMFNEDMIGLKGIAKRAVFVIDRNGTIRHRDVLDDARNEPDYGAVMRVASQL
jgi:glutaredoxin-dependent peroxiredoxin